jgi:S-adenosylmethionine:tRNA ribosyltransferase-isomerase
VSLQSAEEGTEREGEILLSDYDYDLPLERIAQDPATPRDASRLMVLDRSGEQVGHHAFRDLPALLREGDLLVLNDTKVVPARLVGRKKTGGLVEFLFLPASEPGDTWQALCDGARGLRAGSEIDFQGEATAVVLGRSAETVTLRFSPGSDVAGFLERRGATPLPPYIRRDRDDPRQRSDTERYQTVYARHPGAVAAPTAGLHFTPQLLEVLAKGGIGTARVTLHVGPGTFLPVRVADARRHRILPEPYFLSEDCASAVKETRRRGRRVVAVGTTAVRALEHAAREGELRASHGPCDLTILPGHRFRCVDALITNFHLPRSSLLLLVCAFGGRERILRAYREAVEARYRFTSYGDAMLLL